MVFGKKVWERLQVDLDDNTFSMKLKSEKKKDLVAGKIAREKSYASIFKLEGSVLVAKPEVTSRMSIKAVADSFELMLEEGK